MRPSASFIEAFLGAIIPRILPGARVSVFANPARCDEFTLTSPGRVDALSLTVDYTAAPIAELTRIEKAVVAWLGSNG